ncbi:MAG: hypothetical protein AAGA31_16915 [Bacteroidota bacterium]
MLEPEVTLLLNSQEVMLSLHGPRPDTIFFKSDIDIALDSMVHYGLLNGEKLREGIAKQLYLERPNSLIDILWLIPGVMVPGSERYLLFRPKNISETPEGYWLLYHFNTSDKGTAKLNEAQAKYLTRRIGVGEVAPIARKN